MLLYKVDHARETSIEVLNAKRRNQQLVSTQLVVHEHIESTRTASKRVPNKVLKIQEGAQNRFQVRRKQKYYNAIQLSACTSNL